MVEGVAEDLAARHHRAGERSHHRHRRVGAACDGQILVTDDMLGLFEWTPKFVRRYGAICATRSRARRGAYAPTMSAQAPFPAAAETYFAKT